MVRFRLPSPWQSIRKLALTITVPAVMSVGVLSLTAEASAGDPQATLSREALPAQALQVEHRIRNGGPFAYENDGRVFGNRERRLPLQPRGYYKEYTVPTPGSPDRGARRIVCGGSQPTSPDVCYYTGDHYASFSRIVK